MGEDRLLKLVRSRHKVLLRVVAGDGSLCPVVVSGEFGSKHTKLP